MNVVGKCIAVLPIALVVVGVLISICISEKKGYDWLKGLAVAMIIAGLLLSLVMNFALAWSWFGL
ncbi:MAG: hypothetical protein AAB563_00090 [Patescibacteria group bacterium]